MAGIASVQAQNVAASGGAGPVPLGIGIPLQGPPGTWTNIPTPVELQYGGSGADLSAAADGVVVKGGAALATTTAPTMSGANISAGTIPDSALVNDPNGYAPALAGAWTALDVAAPSTRTGALDVAGPRLLGPAMAFAAAPTLGFVYYENAANQLVAARADASATCYALVGPYQGATGFVATTRQRVRVFLQPGLVGLASGQALYLSTTNAGAATNVEPDAVLNPGAFIVPLGTLLDATGYNPLTGAVAWVLFAPFPAIGPLLTTPEDQQFPSFEIDDFTQGPFTTGTTIQGSNLYYSATNGAGSGFAAVSGGVAEPGAWQLTTGTTVGGRAAFLAGQSQTVGNQAVGAVAPFAHEHVWQVPVVSGGAEQFWVQVGLGDQATAGSAGNYGLFWRQEQNGNMSAVIRTAGVEAGSALNLFAFPAATWVRTRITNDGVTIRWQYGFGRGPGALSTLHSVAVAGLAAGWATNLVGSIVKIQKAVGTTARTVQVGRRYAGYA